MTFLIRKSVVLAKIEASYGTDAAPGAADAILVSNLEPPRLQADSIDRELIRPYLGASEQLVGTRRVEIAFTVELAGSGTPDQPPAWGALLRACGYAETVVPAGTGITPRVEYTPVSDGFESLTIHWYGGGVVHKIVGARGTAEIDMTIGQRPTARITLTGLDAGVVTGAPPAADYGAWRKPVPVAPGQTGNLLLGAGYANGALSGGTAWPSRGIQINLGNEVAHVPLIGGEEVIIRARTVTGQVALDLSDAERKSLYDQVIANGTSAVGFSVGTQPGATILVHAPAAQLTQPQNVDQEGLLLTQYDLRLVPQSGDDEIIIVHA
ncbi:MAG: hypothetical protein KatS3mg119_1885 [Rhodothalassiaceae bacterium]|nr:MAG: hypothetical protein KatS3mg119_1885 [Rhodothalassiaceae bacterium]